MRKNLKKAKQHVKVELDLNHNERLVIAKEGQRLTSNPKSLEISRPYWNLWVGRCLDAGLAEDRWPTGEVTKMQELYRSTKSSTLYTGPGPARFQMESIPISEMHTMRLVNSIRWCIREARRSIYGGSLYVTDQWVLTLPQILAKSPQWRGLIAEAQIRNLKMIQGYSGNFAPWFEECKKVIVFAKLQE